MDIEELKEILSRILHRKDFELNAKTHLIDDLGMCSFEIMMLIGEIERKTNKSINVRSFSDQLNVESLLSSIK